MPRMACCDGRCPESRPEELLDLDLIGRRQRLTERCQASQYHRDHSQSASRLHRRPPMTFSVRVAPGRRGSRRQRNGDAIADAFEIANLASLVGWRLLVVEICVVVDDAA